MAKTKLTVGIVKPSSTPQISGDDYVQLVRDAISMWNDALCKYSKKAAHKHLRKIEFKVSENFKGDEDVLVQWWYSDRGNGITLNMDNTPQMEGKKKSYGHLADMGKIMSIVDFINSES